MSSGEEIASGFLSWPMCWLADSPSRWPSYLEPADVVSRICGLFRQVPHPRSSEDMNRQIGEVCRLMADEIAVKDVRIKTNLEPDLPAIALDRIQVQRVLVNLIRNGIEAMDAVVDGARAPQVRSSRDGPDAIRVEVRDAGAGIEDGEGGVEPFFTAKQHGWHGPRHLPFDCRIAREPPLDGQRRASRRDRRLYTPVDGT